jgi:hypothetical protein
MYNNIYNYAYLYIFILLFLNRVFDIVLIFVKLIHVFCKKNFKLFVILQNLVYF